MSRFDQISNNQIQGDYNVIGSNNHINNQTNITNKNTHINVRTGSSNGDNPIGLIVGIGFVIIVAVWFLLGNFNAICNALELATMLSSLFVLGAAAKLTYYDDLSQKDMIHYVASFVLIVGTYIVIYFLRGAAPNDLINHAASSASSIEFFKGLSTYGREVSISIFTGAVIIVFIVLINLYVAVNCLSNALADQRGTGFWFGLCNLTKGARSKLTFIIAGASLLLAVFSFNGSLVAMFN